MSDRITVVFNDKNIELLRKMQAKLIVQSPKSVSFSRVVNMVLAKGFSGNKL